MKILKLKNIIIEIKSSIEQLNYGFEVAKERHNELEDKSADKSQKECWKGK